jgi:hypothetical protein
MLTEKIMSLGELEDRFRVFGWRVETCDGHDTRTLREAFASFNEIEDRPGAPRPDDQGKGVSFWRSRCAAAAAPGTRARSRHDVLAAHSMAP